MSPWKDALCLLAIFLACGLAGHLDYQDAIAMEAAMREDTHPPCSAPSSETAERAPRSQPDRMTTSLALITPTPEPACRPNEP